MGAASFGSAADGASEHAVAHAALSAARHTSDFGSKFIQGLQRYHVRYGAIAAGIYCRCRLSQILRVTQAVVVIRCHAGVLWHLLVDARIGFVDRDARLATLLIGNRELEGAEVHGSAERRTELSTPSEVHVAVRP